MLFHCIWAHGWWSGSARPPTWSRPSRSSLAWSTVWKIMRSANSKDNDIAMTVSGKDIAPLTELHEIRLVKHPSNLDQGIQLTGRTTIQASWIPQPPLRISSRRISCWTSDRGQFQEWVNYDTLWWQKMTTCAHAFIAQGLYRYIPRKEKEKNVSIENPTKWDFKKYQKKIKIINLQSTGSHLQKNISRNWENIFK